MERFPPEGPARAILGPNQIRGGIERLRHQIAELEAFDPSSVRVRGAAETRAIQSAIAMTLAKTFGDATSEHDRYASAARLDNGPMYLSGRPPVELVVGWIQDGKARSLALLQQAVTDLQNELAELEDAAAEQSLASEPAKLVTRDDALLVTGTDMEQNGGDVVAASAGEARENLAARKDVKHASEPANEFQGGPREHQRDGDFVRRFAGNIREAAHVFESDTPLAARGFNSAADYVESAAETMRNGNFRDLLDSATDFAKQKPVAFLGISLLAGFAVIGFLNASTGKSSSSQGHDAPS